MKTTLWGGGTIGLTELEGGQRLYVGSDNHLYREMVDDNPRPYSDGGGTFHFPDPLDEIRLEEVSFIRQKWDDRGRNIRDKVGEGCVLYKGSIRGTLEIESHSPELVAVSLLAKLFPHGNTVYRKDGVPLTIVQWGARDLMLRGFLCDTKEVSSPTKLWLSDRYELRNNEIGWHQTALAHDLWSPSISFEDGTTDMEYARQLDMED